MYFQLPDLLQSGQCQTWVRIEPENGKLVVSNGWVGEVSTVTATQTSVQELREETAGGGPARLEYYETEKKWRNNALPKKYIIIYYQYEYNYIIFY